MIDTKPHSKEEAGAKPVRLLSESLFGANKEVVIVHKGREYRLRLTQNSKLILTA